MYYVVYFKVRGNIKEVFMVDAMEATLVNLMVFMYQHAQDVKVTSTRYRKANGILSPSSNDIDNP